MTKIQKTVASRKMKTKRLELRNRIFGDIDPKTLWDRQKEKGFTTIPRTLSLIMNMMDILSKGKPASKAYFTLWCRAFDEMTVTIKNESEYAFESGFGGQRAVITWRERMATLEELGFIKVKPGVVGKYGYVLLLDPHKIIEELYIKNKTILDTHYSFYHERCLEIGKTMNISGEDE